MKVYILRIGSEGWGCFSSLDKLREAAIKGKLRKWDVEEWEVE